MIEKLAYNNTPLNSYFLAPLRESEHPKNPYDPDQALKLLAEAGLEEPRRTGALVRMAAAANRNDVHGQDAGALPDRLSGRLAESGHQLNLRFVTPERNSS